VITRTQRSVVVAAAVAAIVTAASASDGAYFSQSWGWVALAFLVPSTVLVILDRVPVPGPLRIAFASLTGALAVWIALSTVWSLSVPASAREAERMLVYVAVALAIALVLRRGDGPAVTAGVFVGVTLAATYGLVTRLFPDRFDTSIDVFNATRLAEPLGYWNAFGLVTAIGAILAVGLVAHARRRRFAIVGGACAPIFLVALYLSFSRGSWVALFFGMAATIALDPRRITMLWAVLALAPASVVGVAYASRLDALTTDEVPAADVARDGHRLAAALAALIVASAILGWAAHRIARAVPAAARVRRGFAIVLGATAAVAAAAAVLAVGGPASAVTELRDRFEGAPAIGPSLNDRLFSISGTGRAETIAVAWDTAKDHPVLGTGAGTYEIIWYEDRPSPAIVRDAHSLYAETLAELGIVGLVLLLAALAVPVVAALRSRRTRFVAPACGAYLAWLAASALDWHWEMVSLTTTALLLGAVGLVTAERRSRGSLHDGSRLALAGVLGTLSVLAVWSLVGNQALFAGRDAVQRRDWGEANDDARRAQALLVWSHEPDLVRGDAAAGLGDREGALRARRDAVEKDPRNWLAWLRWAQVERGAESDAAYNRVRELNPRVEGLPGG
jgi:O-antigen ligase